MPTQGLGVSWGGTEWAQSEQGTSSRRRQWNTKAVSGKCQVCAERAV